jgi:integrase/recombinase XerC
MRGTEDAATRYDLFDDLFTDAEVDVLRNRPGRDGALLTVMFDEGLKLGECLRLRVGDVDGTRGALVIHGRNGRGRWLPASDDVARKLKDLAESEGLSADDYVWSADSRGTATHRRAMSRTTFYRWWRRSLKAAGVRYRPPRFARHTFAVRALTRGVDVQMVALLLGHMTLRDTAVHFPVART